MGTIWWPLRWKKSSAKIKICWHPQTRLNKLSRSYYSNGVDHLKQCLHFFMVRKGFMSRSRAKSAFFGGSKTALSKFAKLFLPQIIWSWCKSRVFWNPLAFSFQIKLPKKKFNFWFWVQNSTLLWKSLCSEIFLKRYFFGKVTPLVINKFVMTFFEQIYIIVLHKQQVCHTKKDGKM